MLESHFLRYTLKSFSLSEMLFILKFSSFKLAEFVKSFVNIHEMKILQRNFIIDLTSHIADDKPYLQIIHEIMIRQKEINHNSDHLQTIHHKT